MGKLAVVFFAALAIQAAFGGVVRNFGYGQEELRDLLSKVVKVADDVCLVLGNERGRLTWDKRDLVLDNERMWEDRELTTLGGRGLDWEDREINWENHKFVRVIDEIIKHMEEMTTTHVVQVKNVIFTIVRELREIRNWFKECMITKDETAIRRVEMVLVKTIRNLVKHLETCVVICEEEGLVNDILYRDIKIMLERFILLFRCMCENVDEYKNLGDIEMYTTRRNNMLGDVMINNWEMRDVKTCRVNEIREIVQRFEILMKRVNIDNVLMQRVLIHLVREYLDNMRDFVLPELHHYYELFFKDEKMMWSMPEIMSHMWNYMERFMNNMEQMPETACVAFWKATLKFQNRVEIMLEVNTPVREMVLRMHAITDFLITKLEVIPMHSTQVKHLFVNCARKFYKQIERFIVRFERTETRFEGHINWRKIMTILENGNWDVHAFIVAIQEMTTEMHKWIVMCQDTNEIVMLEITTEYLEILKEQKRIFFDLFRHINDPEFWSMNLIAKTSRMAIYFHGEVSMEDKRHLVEALRSVFVILENHHLPEFKETCYRLKMIIEEFEVEKYLINTFLQKIQMELDKLLWHLVRHTGSLPTEMVEILCCYMAALENIFYNHRIHKGLLIVQTPAETVIRIEAFANRVNRLFHIMVPEFKHTAMFYRGHHFYQMLEIFMFKLRKINHVNTHEIYERLNKILMSLKTDLKEHDKYFNMKLASYIQETIMCLKTLAFEHNIVNDADCVRMYSCFLYGMKHLLNQVHCDFQLVMKPYTIKTLNMQINSVYQRISVLLQRLQLKPELKRVIITQIEVLIPVMEYWTRILNNLSGVEGLSEKYTILFEQLRHLTKMGHEKSIEELCVLLDVEMRNMVLDMDKLTHLVEESPELNKLYRYTLVRLCNIMVRLESIHYFEYYHVMINTQDLIGLVRKVSKNVVSMLEHESMQNKEVVYDLCIQIVKYIHRLEKVAGRFQIEARVVPKRFYEMFAKLGQIRPWTKLTVHELKSYLVNCIMGVVTEMEHIIKNESRVGIKNGLVRYMVAIEKLYVHVKNILYLRNENKSLHRVINHVGIHVHYVTKALEYVNPRNEIAYEILQKEHRHLVEFVNVIVKKLRELRGYSGNFEHKFNELFESELMEVRNYNSIHELKVNMDICIKRIFMGLREICWATSDLSEVYELTYKTEMMTTGVTDIKMFVKTMIFDYLMMLQRMHLDIETLILTPQKWHMLIKWGFLKGNNYDDVLLRDANVLTNKYDDEYYGTYMKHFNKWEKRSYLDDEYLTKNKLHGYFNKMQYKLLDRVDYNTKYDIYNKYGMDWENKLMLKDSVYETKNDIWGLVKNMKMIVKEVTEDLRLVGVDKHEIHTDVNVCVCKLIQILDNIIDRLVLKTDIYDIKLIINNLKQIKLKLEQVRMYGGVFHQVGQLRYILCNCLEQIVVEIERLTTLVRHEDMHLLKDICLQFVNCVRDLKVCMDKICLGRELVGTKTMYNMKPWLYTNSLRNPLETRQWKLW